jgi:hypothetical protein
VPGRFGRDDYYIVYDDGRLAPAYPLEHPTAGPVAARLVSYTPVRTTSLPPAARPWALLQRTFGAAVLHLVKRQ